MKTTGILHLVPEQSVLAGSEMKLIPAVLPRGQLTEHAGVVCFETGGILALIVLGGYTVIFRAWDNENISIRYLSVLN